MSFSDPQWSHVVASEPHCHFDGQPMPRGVLAVSVTETSGWPEIAEYLRARQDSRDALVGQGQEERKTVWRETDIVDQGAHNEKVLAIVRQLLAEFAEPFFGCKIRSLESPHILRYTVGSYYRPHADSDDFNPDTQKWEKTRDRDLSFLLYLDDDYEGGEINFPNFDFQLRPRAGMLLMFPSDCRYLHGVLPVTAGKRHSIVSWCNIHPRK
ncbi:MAG: 2OG-Fe(II) oxygenase [Pseudomonadota bacterium]